jgi:hypothetical protein
LNTFLQAPDLSFRDVFAEELIDRVAREEEMIFGTGPEAIYTVAVVVWAFLTQVASKDQMCRATVARILAYLVTTGKEPCSAGPPPPHSWLPRHQGWTRIDIIRILFST